MNQPALNDAPPHVRLPLDARFQPLGKLRLDYELRAARDPRAVAVGFAIERTEGEISRWEGRILGPGNGHEAESAAYLRHTLKFLLWARGGATVHVAAPETIQRLLAQAFEPGGSMHFDAGLMARAFDRPLAVKAVDLAGLPAASEGGQALGGHRDGCRIGFDLGASDYKIAAVRDGEPVFSAEFPWHPVVEPDPAYHYQRLNDGLRQAAAHLPRVDAIGGSSAGIIVDNKIMVASLFRAVAPDRFERDVKTLFHRLQAEWGVPLAVANDGDVTALAGAMAWNRPGILGIAMGSSEAAGYIDPNGRILGWLNELAFAPVDARPDAPRDEWSGAAGVGAQYFSQQAVSRLLPAAGIELAPEMPLPERLLHVQKLAAEGDHRAERIFETIGGYLGHTLPLYHQFYPFSDVLILGRVTSGRGGEILMASASCVLQELYGEVGAPFRVRVPDEKSRRVGQAVAAASLPPLATT
ncbi:MAG TPA: ROK family protein [Kiritimatiellia bacterium]|nr:ROK family protein [Kiritimatiellia bacterium]